ncbi:MAG: sodium/sugar symporter [Chitinophagaceae bacterium]|jgi:SSS family solute:Na+ symporter|nr:sodium/sugar symporter [Chitinophagaceae bacterium]MBP6045494.1 sodium/sugar symporter [Ferruginibacter sp.]MBK7089021.1 sodium/sugar symporter [Chitinophagaceae bacterium]MBK7347815.1 sodium/sugar symporter [Chitinophagaceae bacterium]MBL0254069.1 sodium/sugar symporter [Chitinophagaceae bacterium]
MNTLSTNDYIVFFIYFFMVAGYGLWVYRKKKKESVSASHDYFLAEGSLTWWAIGASLIASNISAEQFIGMSGSGFKMGLAIATYEWMAAATLMVVAIFFIPVYLKNKIYTMPQFLNKRYNSTVAMIMAVFWLLLYVLVNLTSILYLGALAINSISGISTSTCMYLLAAFAIIITLGGMKVIGYTDVIQVLVLVIGGLITTYLALNLVSDEFGTTGVINGFNILTHKANDHFHMVFDKTNPNYIDLPGISVLIGGMWIVNLNYWGCNQYITQRALGADLKTARNGILFASFLKLLMPVIVVLPGIAAYVLHQQGNFQTEMMQNGELNPDRAYPVLLNLLGPGLKGLAFAALTAAVVASLAGKANSIATIFTLDIYKKNINPNADEKKQVWIGRVTIIVAMVLAVIIAPFLGIDKKGGFQYIQEYTGFVSPGIFAMFLLGFFWKKTTSNAALFATIGGFLLSVFFKFLPQFVNLSFLYSINFAVPNAEGIYEIPFIDRMAIVFLLCVTGMALISFYEIKKGIKPQGLEIDKKMFKMQPAFLVGALIVCGILAALYIRFW